MRVGSKRINFPKLAALLIPPMLLTTFLWSTSENDVSVLTALWALVLLWLPWYSYQQWRKTSRVELPLFPMISFIYWLFYGFPLFWGQRTVLQVDVNDKIVSEESISTAIIMILIGVFSLRMGMQTKIGLRLKPNRLPYLRLNRTSLNYLRAIIFGGIIGNLVEISPYILGEGGRQLVLTGLTLVPTIAFAILFREYLRGNSGRVDKGLLAIYILARFIAGISLGWLGISISIIIVCASIYITERKKIPALIISLAVVSMLFFQVGKTEFRKTYWKADEEAGKIERIEFWVNASFNKWGEAISDPSGKTLKDAISPSIERVSLLTQAANVVDLTPSVVPYQYGRLYSYLFIGLIPRFFWPDKPSANDANQFYQIAYGLSTEDDLNKVSISIGVLTEGFMNFGWFGVVLIMFLLGIFLDYYQNTFFSKNSGNLMNGIGFGLLPQFLGVDTQLAVYLGGIIQSLILILLVMLPIISFNRASYRVKDQPVLLPR